MIPNLDDQAWMEQDALDKMAEALKDQQAEDFAVLVREQYQAVESWSTVLDEVAVARWLAEGWSPVEPSHFERACAEYGEEAGWPAVLTVIANVMRAVEREAAEIERRR